MGFMESPEESNFQKETERSCYGPNNMNDIWVLNTEIKSNKAARQITTDAQLQTNK